MNVFAASHGPRTVGAHGCAPLATPNGRLQGAQPCAPTLHARYPRMQGAHSAPLRGGRFV
jgi:hypothetical protein